jgi:hypothetical protein
MLYRYENLTEALNAILGDISNCRASWTTIPTRDRTVPVSG